MDERSEGRLLIPVLNGFRAYAILAVVLFHLLMFASPAFDYGPAVWIALGGQLDTFFIVSGFGLFLSVVKRGDLGGLGTYARKRFARLIPSYWFTLTLILVLIAATGTAFPGPSEIAVQYAGLQTPAHLVDANLLVGFGVDQPLWMISVIVGLYVLLGLAWRPYLRHPLIGLALAAAITTGWKLAGVHLTESFARIEGFSTSSWAMQIIVIDQVPGWTFSFALGMTCAWAYVRFAQPRPREQLERLAVWAAPVALGAFGVCAFIYAQLAMDAGGGAGGAAARSSPLFSLALTVSRAAVIGVIILGPALWAKPFASRAAQWLTEVSYGVYLIHFVVAIYVGQRLLGLPDNGTLGNIALWIAVVIPPSLAFGYLTTRFLEGPARAWATRERPPTPPAPSPARQQPRPPDPGGPIPAEGGRA